MTSARRGSVATTTSSTPPRAQWASTVTWVGVGLGLGLGLGLGVRVGVGFSRVGVGMGLGLLVRVGLDVSMATPSISRSARTASPFAIQQRVVPD